MISDLDCCPPPAAAFFDPVREIAGDWGFDNTLFNIDFSVFHIADFTEGIR